jgi:hypothetical protein
MIQFGKVYVTKKVEKCTRVYFIPLEIVSTQPTTYTAYKVWGHIVHLGYEAFFNLYEFTQYYEICNGQED